jgi:hypothetical protein
MILYKKQTNLNSFFQKSTPTLSDLANKFETDKVNYLAMFKKK